MNLSEINKHRSEVLYELSSRQVILERSPDILEKLTRKILDVLASGACRFRSLCHRIV